MRHPGIATTLLLCLLAASASAGQTPAAPNNQQPPPSRPFNPTQEVTVDAAAGPAIAVGPAKLRIGGYVGLTGLYRSTAGGGGTGTNFASIPYDDTAFGNLSETRLSGQASRLTLRVDADFPEERPRFKKLAGYFEMDFNGATSGTIAVTSTSAGLRLRHAFAEVQYRETFYMGVGQAFSLMTPPKDQITMWPADVEMSQAVDTNYLAGMVWGRIPQFRLAWRPSKKFNYAFSLENPEQQLGKSLVTLPACCASDLDAEYNTGSDTLNVPNLMPDAATRVAFNPSPAVHLDVGGVLRVFRHKIAPYDSANSYSTVGGGGNINGSIKPAKSTKVLGQFAFGAGIGRYIGGLVPDATFNADSSIDPLNTRSWVVGAEQAVNPMVSIAGYYSGVDTDKAAVVDTDGKYIGFGFPGSSKANNKSIQEVTLTGSFLAFKMSDRGSVQVSLQYSWLERTPWDAGKGPSSAAMNLFFAQVRFNLP